MGYKTVLVHLNNAQRARRLLSVGTEIAAKFEAHLIGLHVFPSYRISPPLPLPLGGEIAAQIRGSIKKDDEEIHAIFIEATRHQPFTGTWRSVTTDRTDPARIVLRHSHACDIVIASQADPSWQLSDLLDFPERLAMGAGRPVLVVPLTGLATGLPGNISIAWRNTRESARALADAMPLLSLAKRVHLVTVAEDPDAVELEALEAVKAQIGRHGIVPFVTRVEQSEPTVGEEIRVRAIEAQADMLVMGCYGHSRLREIALGGVSRHLLRETTIPLFLSH